MRPEARGILTHHLTVHFYQQGVLNEAEAASWWVCAVLNLPD
jgi:hypothetical protein